MTTDDININDTLTAQVNYRLLNALSESETRFRAIIEQLDEVVFTIDTNGCFSFLNQAWQVHTGYEIEETLGQPLQNFIYIDDVEQYLQFLQYFSNGVSTSFEIRFLDKNQNIVWFDVSLNAVRRDDHSGYSFGRLVNISNRIKATEDLETSQERFRLAATASNDGIWDWNLLTNEVYFSPRWKEMLGYSDNELANCYETWSERIHPEDFNETITTLNACLEGNTELYENVHRLKNKTGGWSWILDRGIVLRDESGRALRMAGSHADITQLKQIEETLIEREQELNTIFNISPDGIVTVSRDGIINSINPKFLMMTGFSFEELITVSEEEFTKKMVSISSPELPYLDEENQHNTMVKILPNGNKVEKIEKIEHKNSGIPVGSSLNMRILKVTVCHQANESLSKVLYFQDVTIESEVDRMKSEFLSSAAHELRTPMSSVYGFTELLMTREFDKATTQEILKNIYQQSESLIRMLNDLLDLAKIEARMEKEFQFKNVSLQSVINQSLAEFLVKAETHTIETTYLDESDTVYIDFDQTKRAVTNIISNAVKYSPDGGKITIKTISRTNDNGGYREIGLVIKDQGIGMTQEQLSHIFERFWRAPTTVKIIGTGLGMSLVKEIMQIQKGLVEIHSELGQGTEVSLWFKASSNDSFYGANHEQS